VCGEPGYDSGPFHSIDFGLELDLDDGATWSFTWQQASYNETLLCYAGTIGSELRPGIDVSTWDVSDVWRSALPRAISTVGSVWTKHRWGPAFGGPRFETRVDDGHESEYCLVTVLLHGGPGEHVVITLGGDASYGERRFTYLADNVAVFFSLPDARAHGVLLPGDPDALPLA
jgi:hypothetical protein